MGAHVARLVDLGVHLGGSQILSGIDLSVERGRQLAVLGRSGAGKSTLLRVLEGEVRPTSGSIQIEGGAGAQRQAVVYQQALLFEWLTVAENVALGQRYRRNGEVAPARIDELLALLEIEDLRDRYPDQISGGQAQRVALGRALAVEPDLLLLDEPFSALDPATRFALQDWLRAESRREALTSVIVTHDIDEALLLADDIVLLAGGRIARRWSVDADQRDAQHREIRAAFDDPHLAASDAAEQELAHV